MANEILRISVDGRWRVVDWTHLFGEIDEFYSELITIEHFSARLDLAFADLYGTAQDVDENEFRNYSKLKESVNLLLDRLPSSAWYRKSPPDLQWMIIQDEAYRSSTLNLRVSRNTDYFGELWTGFAERKLLISRIRYGSPGFIEFLGSLNPFKLIADCVRDWRKENTERGKYETQNELESKKLDFEREKLSNQDEIEKRNSQLEKEKLESHERIEREKLESQERTENNKIRAELFKYLSEQSIPLRNIVYREDFDEILDKTAISLEKKITSLMENPMITDIKLISPAKRRKKQRNNKNKKSR